MCGIIVHLGTDSAAKKLVETGIKSLESRGPENTRLIQVTDGVTFGFTRLAINGLTISGMQPFHKGNITWMCNGEIYNSNELNTSLGIINAGSDCFCIGDLYLRHKDNLAEFARSLDGVFALAIYDAEMGRLIMARDPYGIRPLYVGTNKETVTFASEMKALPNVSNARHILPGTLEVYDVNSLCLLETIRYNSLPSNTDLSYTLDSAKVAIRSSLLAAVEKRMLTDRPIAALLSGGLDSSLIASLIQRILKNNGLPPLRTFSIGFQGSSDLKHAKIVADYIGSNHTEVVMTPDVFFNAIPEVIKAIESYDTTTVRASVGNYLISKEIRLRTDSKVVFNGDGADELFGGYLYFNKAPSDADFHAETARLLENIYMFDVLRSDRSISSNGLEARTPYLDKSFVALVHSLDPSFLRPIQGEQVEKSILREALRGDNLLPLEILMRRKEAFSDGVSSPEKSWFQEIQDRVLKCIPYDWKKQTFNMTHLAPQSAEDYYYRTIYNSYYPDSEKVNVPYKWMPMWSPETTDPSARTLNVYSD